MAQYGAMMSHSVMHVVGDVKPRLTKEQHDILEAHFVQQHKPSTQTKKSFAESLGVPLDKINNWFQNRRAKVKQDAKKALNAQNMFMQQQHLAMAQQMQHSSATAQHPDFYLAHPHLAPSLFPMDPSHNAIHPSNPDFMLPNQHHMIGGMASFSEAHQGPAQGYPMDGVDMSTIVAKSSYMAFDPSQDFAFDQFNANTHVQDFAAMNGDMGTMDGLEFPILAGAPMSFTQSNGSTPSIPSTLSSMPSNSTMQSSIGSIQVPTLSSTEWNDDAKPTICLSEVSDGAVRPQAAYSSPPEESNTANWVSQQPAMEQTASPVDFQRPGSAHNLPLTPPDSRMPGELELPQELLSRRPSSTMGLSESFGNVDIDPRSTSTDDSFKQPGEPSSLAARRQRPRPAALGQAALRSASYSAGMPLSPGSNPNNLNAPEQQLRRIRSSGVPGAQPGRIQKPSGAGQRSPLHMSFADAAASPKFARQTSNFTVVSSSDPHSLAPPTPLTPHEGGRFPSWQSTGSVNSYIPSLDHSSPNGVAVSWTSESPALFQPHAVSSPPETPLDPARAAQYVEYHQNMNFYRDTPPQSAPAHQQSFGGASFGFPFVHEPHNLGVSPAHLAHVRRPSLPENSKAMVPHAPLMNASTGDMPLTYQPMPYDVAQMQVPPQPSTTLPSQTTAAFPTPPQPAPAPMPAQHNVLAADFAVHEYLPPGAQARVKNSASPTNVDNASAPRMFHFSNTGPKDFAGQQ